MSNDSCYTLCFNNKCHYSVNSRKTEMAKRQQRSVELCHIRHENLYFIFQSRVQNSERERRGQRMNGIHGQRRCVCYFVSANQTDWIRIEHAAHTMLLQKKTENPELSPRSSNSNRSELLSKPNANAIHASNNSIVSFICTCHTHSHACCHGIIGTSTD